MMTSYNKETDRLVKNLSHRLTLLVNYKSWGCYCKDHENQSTIVKRGLQVQQQEFSY